MNINDEKYVKGNEASKILNVHQRTLYEWEKKGWIETIRSKGWVRHYNVNKYLRETNSIPKQIEIKCTGEEELEKLGKCNTKLNISYAMLST